MPRPKKWRNVCCLPESREYGPLDRDFGADEAIKMTVEEFEAVRLIDHVEMSQEECAERMCVSRTTVQDIYSKARRKLACSLVEGAPLIIEGGRYRICEHSEGCCRRKACRRDRRNVTFEIKEKQEAKDEDHRTG
ncbi:MAG: uncharacterized protein PWR17_265 [Candidatus Methanomethylophilaceae archaeon]|nr:uncharacterized protein [Candidatus Methanomethylophilaceae archaeon]